MTTVTITYDDLVDVEYVDYTYKIVSPVIASNFRAYGSYAEFVYETTTGVVDNGPAYIYLTGSAGVTAYNVPDPLDRDYNSARYFVAVGHPVLGNFGAVDTADSIGLGNHADSVYAGPGKDSIYAVATTSTAAKYLVGGSGDDTIQSSYGADILYGDFADAPVFVTDTQWQKPASADPAVVDGKDYLDGNYGPDTLYGGGGDDVLIGDPDVDSSYDDQDELHGGDGNDQLMGGTAADQLMGDDGDDVLMGQRGGDTLVGGDGNDMLNGGPRGSGWTDVLTGGAGSDAFMLSYTPASDSDTSDGQSFWQSWGADFVANAGGGGVSSGVTDLSTAAAKAFFESLTGSILLGGLSTAIGGAVTNALSFLFHQSKSSTPQPSGEDVMVVTDFDPRDDVLFLPLPTVDQNNPATTLTSTPTYYSESAAGSNGQTGWGIEFAKGTGNTIFAEVFLAQDFLDAFGVTEDSEFANDFIHDVFDTSLVIDENGVQDFAERLSLSDGSFRLCRRRRADRRRHADPVRRAERHHHENLRRLRRPVLRGADDDLERCLCQRHQSQRHPQRQSGQLRSGNRHLQRQSHGSDVARHGLRRRRHHFRRQRHRRHPMAATAMTGSTASATKGSRRSRPSPVTTATT